MNDFNTVLPDTSSAFLKYSLLKSKGYLSRSRWERAGTIDVLQNNYEYYTLLTQDKTPFAIDKGVSRFGQQIDVCFFTDNKGYYLYSTVLSHKKPATDSIMATINATKKPEVFAAASVFINKEDSVETARGGLQIETLPSIQLFRYDPVGKGYHVNTQNVRSIYPNLTSEQAKLYEEYFEHTVNFPHFHFPNKSMAVAYGKTAESDAISLDSLVSYVKDLIELPKEKADILLSNTFGMPYLSILFNPETYSTTVNLHNLKDVATHITQSYQLSNIFSRTLNVKNEETTFTGLNAVYADLTVLKMLRTLSQDDDASPTELALACKVASGGLLYPTRELEDTTFDIDKACDIVTKKTPPRPTKKYAKRTFTEEVKKAYESQYDEEEVDPTEVATDNPIYGSGNPINEKPFNDQIEESAQMVLDLINLSQTIEQPKTLVLKPNNNLPQLPGGQDCE